MQAGAIEVRMLPSKLDNVLAEVLGSNRRGAPKIIRISSPFYVLLSPRTWVFIFTHEKHYRGYYNTLWALRPSHLVTASAKG